MTRVAFILAAALALIGAGLGTPPAQADAASDRARAMDSAAEAFLIGTWTFSKADAIGTRTLYLRFDKNRTASLKVSGDSNILPGPLSADGVFWKASAISDDTFFLEINADGLVGGGVHEVKRQADGTLIDQDRTVWTRLP